MKALLYILTVGFSILSLSAQTDTLAPKWQKGQVWKVTSTSTIPDKKSIKESVLVYDTCLATFMWEVIEVQDTVVRLGVTPLSIRYVTSNEETLEEAAYLTQAFEILKTAKVSMIYEANSDGTIREVPSEDDSYKLIKNKHFVNEEQLRSLFPQRESDGGFDFDDEYVEEEHAVADTVAIAEDEIDEQSDAEWIEEIDNDTNIYFDGVGIRFWSLVEFFDKIVTTIHSPYGEPLLYDTIINVKDYSDEKWESYQKGLSAMVKMMDVSGNMQYIKSEGEINNKYEMQLNMGNMFKGLATAFQDKKQSKKKKKEFESSMNEMKMELNIKGDLIVDDVNLLPKIFTTLVQSAVAAKGENVSFIATNVLIFE